MSQFEKAGLWPLFEQWKTDVAALAQEARKQGVQVSLWDFGCPDVFTAEPVPMDGDRKTAMRWYWEAGHFKKALGDVVLQTVFGDVEGNRNSFGFELTPANVQPRNRACKVALAARGLTLADLEPSAHAATVNWGSQAAARGRP